MNSLVVVHRFCGAVVRKMTAAGVATFAAKLVWKEGLQALGWLELGGRLVAVAAEWLAGQG